MPEPTPNTDLFPDKPEEGSLRDQTALCLSGGGYRAMVFHVGSLWRLYEAGILGGVERISSVSGGSITAAALGLAWSKLSFDPARLRDDFVPHVVAPIRKLASKTIDANSIISGIFLPGDIADKITKAYKKHIFGDATLQDLPDEPRFVLNATNVQSGALWRFSKPYMRDWRVGEVKNPTIPLSTVVAASSAFPPVLSPLTLELDPASFTPDSGADLQRTPFTSEVVLSDGGVYDNLGLETAKSFKRVLVSDAGGQLAPEEEPHTDWGRHSYRVLMVIDNQVRSLRKRQLIDAYIRKAREGAYWGIRTSIANYDLPSTLPAPLERTTELADVGTRLKRLDDALQERLINWGYAVTDAAIRKHFQTELPQGAFPYPVGV